MGSDERRRGSGSKTPQPPRAAARRRPAAPAAPPGGFDLPLVRELGRARERAEAAADLVGRLNASESLPEVLLIDLDRAARSLGGDGGAIFMFEPDDRHVAAEIELVGGEHLDVVVDVPSCPHLKEALARRAPVCFTREQADGGESSWFAQLGVHATLAAPLVAGEDSFGLLCINYRAVDAEPGPDELAAAAGLARDVAHAIGRACAVDAEREQRHVAEEEARHRGEFLAMLSHELRNPLAPIRNGVYILQHAAPGSPQARRAIAVIDRQSAQLARIVDDLLDVTRMAGGLVQLHRTRVELTAVIREVVEAHRADFADAGTQLELELAPAPLVVEGDPARLAQALGHLLANAAKFTDRGGHVRVALTRPEPDGVTITVSDDGLGMSKATLARLFEPFFQAEQRKLARSRGGLGLGLALVRTIIELHHGGVAAESRGPGRGSVFTLTLPLAPPAEAADPVPAARSRAGRRVLVIEDNADAAHSLEEALAIEGHVVEVAYTGPDGIAAARRFRPEVLLCDIGLPGMDGYAVAREFGADPLLRPVYLIALTGYAQREDRERSAEAGFRAHLVKPATLDAVRRVLATVPEQE